MRALLFWLLLCVGVVGPFAPLFAQYDEEPAPIQHNLPTRGRVVDSSGVLSPDQLYELEAWLADFDAETSVEIQVVIVNDLGGIDAGSFAQAWGQERGIGKKESDNGVVFLLVPSRMPAIARLVPHSDTLGGDRSGFESMLQGMFAGNANRTPGFAERFSQLLPDLYRSAEAYRERPDVKQRPAGYYGEGFIATGYGVEGVLPDVVCHRIMRYAVAPYIVAHEYYDGIRVGVAAVMAECRTEYTKNDAAYSSQGGSEGSLFWYIIRLYLICAAVIFPFAFISKYLSKRKAAQGGSGVSSAARSAIVWSAILAAVAVALILPLRIMGSILAAAGSGRGGSGGGGGGRVGTFSGGGGSFGGGGGGSSF